MDKVDDKEDKEGENEEDGNDCECGNDHNEEMGDDEGHEGENDDDSRCYVDEGDVNE